MKRNIEWLERMLAASKDSRSCHQFSVQDYFRWPRCRQPEIASAVKTLATFVSGHRSYHDKLQVGLDDSYSVLEFPSRRPGPP